MLLSDIAQLNPKIDKSKIQEKSLASFVPMACVTEVSGSIISEEEREIEDVLKGFTYFQNGDILVAKITPCFENGKIALAHVKHEHAFGSTEFHVIRPDASKVDGKYLFHFLRQPRIRIEGEKRMTGSGGQRRVPKSFLEELEIPLPSLPEQRRIAAILDKAEALRSKRREAIAKLDQLLQSVFLEMFGEIEQWPNVEIGEICQVKGGKRLPKGDDYASVPTAFRYIRVSDIEMGAIDANGLRYLKEETQKKISKYTVHSGDVIITIAGTIGLVALVDENLNGINLTENAAKIVSKKDSVYIPGYLSFALSMPDAQSQIKSQTGQATIGKLALFRIEKIKIPLPPIEMQQRFSQVVKQVASVRAGISESSTALDSLIGSLQQNSFA